MQHDPLVPALDRLAYSIDEAAALIGVSRYTMYRLMRDGTLPFARIRGQRRITRDALLQIVAPV
jgi:excisionase family DNA binding protein